MQDLFNERPDTGQGAPDMLMGAGERSLDFSNYNYRVERFSLGSSDQGDEVAGMEALLTRSIRPDRNVVIIERKDSISSTTGVYTCIIIYLERIPQPEGAQNAQEGS